MIRLYWLLCVCFFSTGINAQFVPGSMVPAKSDSSLIIYRMHQLTDFINSESYRQDERLYFIDQDYSQRLLSRKTKEGKQNSGYIKTEVSISIRKIELLDDGASVSCELLQYSQFHEGLKKSIVTIEMRKSDTWVITGLNEFEEVFAGKYYYLKNSHGIAAETQIQPLKLKQNPFVKKHALKNPDTYRIDMDFTREHIDRELFEGNRCPKDTYYRNGAPPPYGNGRESAIYLDPGWKRIIYSTYITPTYIKGYGDNPGDIRFNDPRWVDVNEWGEVFVCDGYPSRVYRMQHSPYTQTLNNPVPFITGLTDLRTVDYYSGNTFWDRSDDVIAVTDLQSNLIKIFSGQGTLLYTISGFYDNGVKPILYPRCAVIYGFEKPYRIAFIDGGSNRLVCARLPEDPQNFPGYVMPISQPVQFESRIPFYSIGIDGCYNVIVTQPGRHQLHKFSKDGKYAFSWYTYPEFQGARFVSNVPDNIFDEQFVLVDFSISSPWMPFSGITRYLPGGNASDFQFVNKTSHYELNFMPEDDILYKLELRRSDNNELVYSRNIDYGFTMMAEKIIIPYEAISTNQTELTWRLLYVPRYNDYYGEYSLPWQSAQGVFFHHFQEPAFAGITQSPSPLCKGSFSKLTASLAQGNGNITYTWEPRDFPQGMYLSSSSGKSVNIVWSSASNLEAVPVVTVACTASNAVNSRVQIRAISLSQCSQSGCPFVYTWDGEVWLEDNNILPQSQSIQNQGLDVTDYYQLYNKPLYHDGKYSLAIAEFEQERSYIDQVRLLVVDHDPGTYISVDDSGSVIQFYKPVSNSSAYIDSVDVLKNLMQPDEITVTAYEGDTLAVSFENLSIGGEKVLVILAKTMVAKDKPAGRVVDKSNRQIFESFRLRKNPSYQWVAVPENTTTSMTVDLVWEKEVEIDFTELSHEAHMPYTLFTPDIAAADHSNNGDIREHIQFTDENYTELVNGEQITLDFPAPPLSDGMERSFILMTRGRYETIHENLALTSANSNQNITEYRLFANHPNPFNPATTISYQIPVPGLVSLKVYDILGREVITLVYDFMTTGKYEATFDASHLASGVYFYEMRINDFREVKKMNLLK